MRYKLRGRWPNGGSSERTGSLPYLQVLAENWSASGADCEISIGSTVISRYTPGDER